MRDRRKAVFSIVLCFCLALYFIIRDKILYDPDGSYGFYYAYEKGTNEPALIVSRDISCELLKRYHSSMKGNLSDSLNLVRDLRYFVMDSTTVAIEEIVELVNFDCDSTVGVITFKNKYFNEEFRESNINPRIARGRILLEDLHKEKPLP